MSAQPLSQLRPERRLPSDAFRAFAVTDDRRTVLAALTAQAVAHFGRDHLMVSNFRVSSSVSAPGCVSYLASGDFAILS